MIKRLKYNFEKIYCFNLILFRPHKQLFDNILNSGRHFETSH